MQYLSKLKFDHMADSKVMIYTAVSEHAKHIFEDV